MIGKTTWAALLGGATLALAAVEAHACACCTSVGDHFVYDAGAADEFDWALVPFPPIFDGGVNPPEAIGTLDGWRAARLHGEVDFTAPPPDAGGDRALRLGLFAENGEALGALILDLTENLRVEATDLRYIVPAANEQGIEFSRGALDALLEWRYTISASARLESEVLAAAGFRAAGSARLTLFGLGGRCGVEPDDADKTRWTIEFDVFAPEFDRTVGMRASSVVLE